MSGWRPVLSVAAACAALLLAVVLHFPGTGDADARVGPSSGSAVEKLEAEQVDRAAEDLDMLRQFSTPARDKRAL
ncbi:MAG TPA: hypothetical protein VES20_20350 [Bryobacteraceae bacterium]|nr:hypothetical protein [Bryobacteraceae bacterium]